MVFRRHGTIYSPYPPVVGALRRRTFTTRSDSISIMSSCQPSSSFSSQIHATSGTWDLSAVRLFSTSTSRLRLQSSIPSIASEVGASSTTRIDGDHVVVGGAQSIDEAVDILAEVEEDNGSKGEEKDEVFGPEETLKAQWKELLDSIDKKEVIPPLPGPPGFEWMCRKCGGVNGGGDEYCAHCHDYKLSPNQWICQTCASKNNYMRSQCFHCQTPISMFWFCEQCKTKTSIYDTDCRNCGASMPPVASVRAKVYSSVLAAKKKASSSSSSVIASKDQKSLASSPPEAETTKGSWVCAMCNKLNVGGRGECFSCGASRERASLAMPETQIFRGGIGDKNWKCVGCGAKNFRTRSTCWKCKMECLVGAVDRGNEDLLPLIKKEGFQPEETSGLEDGMENGGGGGHNLPNLGGREANSWMCPKCFSKNHRSKANCWKCKTSKTLRSKIRLRVRPPTKI